MLSTNQISGGEKPSVLWNKQSTILTNNTFLRILTAYTKRLKDSNTFTRALSKNDTFLRLKIAFALRSLLYALGVGQKTWRPVTFKTTFDSRLLFQNRSAKPLLSGRVHLSSTRIAFGLIFLLSQLECIHPQASTEKAKNVVD